jgi:ABC-type sugar transport system substrate-binding protein
MSAGHLMRTATMTSSKSARVAAASKRRRLAITLTPAIFADSFKQAAAAVGANVRVYDGQGTPAGAAAGVDQAISAHANGIVLSLVDPSTISQALSNAQAAHVPVILGDDGLRTAPFPTGIFGVVSQDQTTMGAWEVDSALKATRCDLHVAVVDTPGNVGSDAVTKGIDAEFQRLYPSSCSMTHIDVQAADLATKLTGSVENAVRLHSETNMVMEVASPYYPYVSAGLKAVGSKLPLITTANMTDLASTGGSTSVVSDVVYAPAGAHGWFYMDAILRLLSGKQTVEEPFPLGLVDSSNRSSSDPSSYAGTTPYAQFKERFNALWGVVGGP